MADRFDLINFSKSVTTTLGGVTANVNIDANTLFVDGTNNRVGIGTAAPATTVDIYDPASAGSPAVRIRDNVSDLRLYPSGGGSYVATISNTPLIFNTNNTERMRIDASGRVTTPFVPAFSVNSRQINGFFNNVTIIYKNVVHNNGSHYSTTSGRFTAPVAGRYFFSASAIASAASGNAQLGIRKNATLVQNNYIDLEALFTPVTVTAVVELAVNDFVDVVGFGAAAVWFDNGGSVVEYNNFSGFLIG